MTATNLPPPRHTGRIGRTLFGLYERIVMVLGLGLLGFLCLFWLPFAELLYALLPDKWGRTVGRLAPFIGFRIYLFLLGRMSFHFDLSVLDSLRHEPPLILVANHPSLLDAVMIVSRLPNAVCIMKAGLMNNVLLGPGARLARYIRNDTGLMLIGQAQTELASGAHLILFPEGSRTANFPLDACGPAAGMLARSCNTPVQSVFIEFNYPYLGKAWPLLLKPTLPLLARVRLGRRFQPQSDMSAFTVELEKYFRTELNAASPFIPHEQR